VREKRIVVERELAREVAERKRFVDVRLRDDVHHVNLRLSAICIGQAHELLHNNNIQQEI